MCLSICANLGRIDKKTDALKAKVSNDLAVFYQGIRRDVATICPTGFEFPDPKV